MKNRRRFLGDLTMFGLGTQLIGLRNCENITPDSSWERIKNQFPLNPKGLLNFNTGSAGVMPNSILDNYISNIRELNSYAPYKVLDAHQAEINRNKVRLAELIGSSIEQLAFIKNTTDGINLVIGALEFDEGDEVIIANVDYPYAENTIYNQLLKSKAVLKKVSLDLEQMIEKEIIEAYASAITSKTKLVLVTHITHREGYIMPVKKIVELAHKNGVEVLVDAAHVVGQIEVDISDLNCDYFVSSLHKWFSAPLGSGVLHIAKKHISKLNGAFAYYKNVRDKIVKFDYLGTRPFQNLMTLGSCIDFNESIGMQKKQSRLNYLRQYLSDGISKLPDCEIKSHDQNACGILAFKPAKVAPSIFVKKMLNDHQIHVKNAGYPGNYFIRVSLNLNIIESDLDKFIEATRHIITTN